jgi:hypothetical protein
MYAWFVALHLVGFAFFLIAHAVSMWVSFRVRGERDRDVIRAMLDLSQRGTQSMYLGLLLLIVGGLAAAWNAAWLTATWVIASYVVFIVVLAAMYAIATPYYVALRGGLEGSEKTPRLTDDELATRLQNRRPEALAAIGGIGLLILIGLMTVKPGA